MNVLLWENQVELLSGEEQLLTVQQVKQHCFTTALLRGHLVYAMVEIQQQNPFQQMAITSYTSQINVTITPDIAGMTIKCAPDENVTSIQFSIVTPMTGILIIHPASRCQLTTPFPILTVIAGPFPPPEKLYISSADFSLRELTFEWSPVGSDCPTIHYNILASNCGSCPTITNHTNVTCTGVPSDDNVCIVSVQPVVCGNITGISSDLIYVTSVLECATFGTNNISSQGQLGCLIEYQC